MNQLHYQPTDEYRKWWDENRAKLSGHSIYTKGAVIWQAAIAAQKPKQAMTDADIPAGVCWSEQGCNFYLADTGAGMGNAFYDEWRNRCDEFPDRDAARRQIAATSSIKEQLVEALQMLLNCEGSFGKRVDAVNKAHAALRAAGVEAA